MSKRARRFFSDEFKAQAVDLVRQSGKSVQQIATDLDLTETSLREWVKSAEGRPRQRVALTTSVNAPSRHAADDELEALRREVRTLRMEREILKKWSCAVGTPATQ